jgi:glycerophosphoryl diester phosphodiesterase
MDRSRTASPEVLADAVIRVIKREKFLERTVLVGFDWPALIEAKRLAPKVECWFTTLPQSYFGKTQPPPEHGPPPAAELEALRAMERSSAPWTGGFDTHRHGSVARAAKAAGADGWFPFHADLTRDSVAEARSLGLKLGAWTVNEPADLSHLIGLGIDGICTDYPDRLSDLLKRL